MKNKTIKGVLFILSILVIVIIFLNLKTIDASDDCKDLSDNLYKDFCYLEKADDYNNAEYCDNIVDDFRRDACYMPFIIDGDYAVCDKLTDVDIKESCVKLSKE